MPVVYKTTVAEKEGFGTREPVSLAVAEMADNPL